MHQRRHVAGNIQGWIYGVGTEATTEDERSVREGCLGLLVALVARVLSVILVCVGLALFLLGVFAFQPSITASTVIKALLALVAAYLLMRVGRDVWQDLTEGLSRRKPDRPDDETSDEEDGT